MQQVAQSTPSAPHKGFALVIALMLMGFIFLLLVSLGSLIQVQTQEDYSKNTLEMARKNAVLGLNAALGQLQMLAGPDQRATAAASVFEDQSTPTVPASNQNWVGVWDSATWNPASPDTRTFLGWLVSKSNSDQLNAVEEEVNPDSATAVKLLASPDNDIFVESIAANSDGSERYAYWIADESLKASIALNDPGLGKSQSNAVQDQLRRSIAFKNDLNKLIALASYDFNSEAWVDLSQRLIDWGNLPQLGNGAGQNWSSVFQDHRHDLTLNARGLLTDNRKGGWRRDLSLAFHDDAIFDSNLAGTRVFNKEDYGSAYRTNAAASKNFFGPRWEILRDYHNMSEPGRPGATNSVTLNVDVTAQQPMLVDDGGIPSGHFYFNRGGVTGPLDTLDEIGSSAVKGQPILYGGEPAEIINNVMAPVITYIGLFFRVQTVLETPAVPGTAAQYKAQLLYHPVVQVWNPYNVSMRLGNTLNVRLYFSPKFEIQKNGVPIAVSVGNRTPAELWRLRGSSNHHIIAYALSTANAVLQPGEIRTFSQNALRKDTHSATSFVFAGTLTSVWNESGATWIDLKPGGAREGGTPALFSGGIPGVSAEDTISVRMELSDIHIEPVSPGTYGNNRPNLSFDLGGSKPGYRSVLHQALVDGTDIETANVQIPVTTIAGNPHPVGGYELFLAPGNDRFDIIGREPHVFADYNPTAQLKGYHTDNSDYISPNIVSRTTTNDTPTASINASGSTMAGYWGDDLSDTSKIYVYDIPRVPLHSIAQLQNATISILDDVPTYAIGNSRLPATVNKTKVVDFNAHHTRIDYSWLLNNELWDSYFFSTVPAAGTTNPATGETFTEEDILSGVALPNSRYRIALVEGETAQALYDFEKAAAQLEIQGAFNVNSTSVIAWKTVLGALGGEGFSYNGGNSGSLDNPFFRHGMPYGKDGDNYQAGWRDLTDDLIEELAKEVVEQVKERGPFMNLADFVNRRLKNDDTGEKGALQSAIDATDINDSWGSNTLAQLAPGYLSQADILSAIGPFLTVRGDTFLIRSYGSVRNPNTNEVEAEAWLEVTVRRIPDYVDNSDPYINSNPEFGRRFVVESIKWLNKEEL